MPRSVPYAGVNTDVITPVPYAAMYDSAKAQIKARFARLIVPYNGIDNDDYVNGAGFCCTADTVTGGGGGTGGGSGNIGNGNNNPEVYQYYYHSDHLGSSSFITNLDGEVSQHIEYVPFGEVFLEERDTTWNTPFMFNGKELDEETGLYYYGARYYNPRTSLWLSVDPLAEKYAGISSYCYTLNNPVKLIDPDGRDTTYRFDMEGKYIGMFDLDAVGQKGSYGTMKTLGSGKDQIQYWDGQYFNFADPVNDPKDIVSGIINRLVFVSDAEIKSMLTEQGAFNYSDKDGWRSFYTNSTGGHHFDYSIAVIPSKYGKLGAAFNPLNTPSPVLFLPEGDNIAHNHMNFGNYLWAASGYTLGFSIGTLQFAAEMNSLINSKTNGYSPQFDSDDDQYSIKLGAFHASEYKYRTILELRHQTEIKKVPESKRKK